MATLYTPKDVRDILKVSASAVRNYVDHYAAHLSETAQRTPRQFTEEDLRLFAYVRYKTTPPQQATHEVILAEIAAGALDDFDWEPPTPEQQAYDDAVQAESAALVPAAQVRALMAMLEDSRRREQAAIERAQEKEAELQERIRQLERELGKAEGELNAIKAKQRKPPRWWIKLFGGSGE